MTGATEARRKAWETRRAAYGRKGYGPTAYGHGVPEDPAEARTRRIAQVAIELLSCAARTDERNAFGQTIFHLTEPEIEAASRRLAQEGLA